MAGVILARAQSSSRVRVIGTFDLKTGPENDGYAEVVWGENGNRAEFSGGKLGALGDFGGGDFGGGGGDFGGGGGDF